MNRDSGPNRKMADDGNEEAVMNANELFGMMKGKRTRLALLLLAIGVVSFAMVVTHPSRSGTRAPLSGKPAGWPASPTGFPKSLNHPAGRYGQLPLSFEANRGQSDGPVKFLSRGSGYALFLTGDEAVLTLKKPANGNRRSSVARRLPNAKDNRPRTTDSVLRMKLVDANPAAHVTGIDELPGKSNYFVGNDPEKWRTNVANYARVKYENVYPGIDLLYYGKQRKLEYDFVVAPGADPQAIRMSIQGAASVSIEPREGSLLVQADHGMLRFHKPVVYQEKQLRVDRSQLTARNEIRDSKFETPHSSQITKRKFLDGRYILTANNRVAFKVAAYDHTKPLIIDPVLSYSTYLGGGADDEPNGVVVDGAGNTYLTGLTVSANFPTTSGALESAPPHNLATTPQCSNCSVVFVTKLNPSGSALVYSTFLGGDHFEEGNGIAVDSSGNAYITGETLSTNFPTTSEAFQTAIGGVSADNVPGAGQGGDAFLTVLNPTGSALVYSTFLGGSGSDQGNAVVVDAAGIAYITGGTTSPNFPTTSSAFQTSGTGENVFVTKMDPSKSGAASLVYSTVLGSAAAGFGITLDSSANAYVTGMAAPNFPVTSGAFQTTAASQSAFVSKIDTSKSGAPSLVYSTYLASDGGVGYAIAVDTSGNAYVTGQVNSATFPTTPGAFQSSSLGTSGLSNQVPAGDAFVTKLNATGSALIYSTLLGGSGGDEAKSIAVDSAGNAYVTGYTQSTDFPTAIPFIASFALQTCNGSGYYGYYYSFPCGTAAFATKLNATGTAPIYSTYLDGNAFADVGRRGIAITVDASGNAYVAGTTLGGLPVTSGAFQTSPGGGNDGFIAKIGTAPGPGAKLSDFNLDFGNQGVGTPSGVRTVTLEDVGDGPLTNISIAPSGDFTETSDCGSSLAAGALCTITIKFTPTVTGTRTGAITVTDNAPDSPQTTNLTGNGTSGAVSLSSTGLNFGSQNLGTTSSAQTVTLTNVGSTLLTITNIATAGDFALTNNCAITVAAGANCTINVTFTPHAAGLIVGVITLTDSAPDSPQIVMLTGTGLAPDFLMSSMPMSAAVLAGQSTTYTVSITPTGGFKQAVALGCTGAPSFATCTVSPTSVTPDGTNPASVTVTVTTGGRSIVAPRFWSRPPAVRTSPSRIREDGYLDASLRMWFIALALMIGLASMALTHVGEAFGIRLWEGSRRAPVRLGFATALLFVATLASISMSACGAGTPPPPVQIGTPAGTYTLNVTGTATSGTATLTHSIILSLTVN